MGGRYSICSKIGGFLSRQCKMKNAKCKSQSTIDGDNVSFKVKMALVNFILHSKFQFAPPELREEKKWIRVYPDMKTEIMIAKPGGFEEY